MSTKKNSTARTGSAKDTIIKERAGAIIANLDAYDSDTRAAIYNALEGVPATLAELVKRAEAGETILDCTDAAHARADNRDELPDFAHHLAEALRIAGDHPWIPVSLYNDLADAWNDFLNELPSLRRFNEDERVIALAIETYITQTAAQTEKGGKR
jgi:hypothetical protein